MAVALAVPSGGAAQPADLPQLGTGRLAGPLQLDGLLDEAAWAAAPAIETLTMSEPNAGGKPSATTTVRVLADAHALVIGIVCGDPDPSRIVSFTKQRDGALESEDNVKIVLDTFLDGRSGYVFQVNPAGARYDALINPGSSDANSNWDGIWDAATHRDERGWSVEIWIPVQTLGFKSGLTQWHFNVERRIHLQINSFVQYDTSSSSVGTNSRLRWTFTPAADLFVIYNHNVRDFENIRWRLESNQLLVKLQYAFRR